jgi:hypothetical protein
LLGDVSSCSWLFRCECGDGGCDHQLELSRDEFDAACRSGEVVVGAGHERARARAAKQEAQLLADEARALCAQAEQILRRRAELTLARGT